MSVPGTVTCFASPPIDARRSETPHEVRLSAIGPSPSNPGGRGDTSDIRKTLHDFYGMYVEMKL